jgi:hypothetical protein
VCENGTYTSVEVSDWVGDEYFAEWKLILFISKIKLKKNQTKKKKS